MMLIQTSELCLGETGELCAGDRIFFSWRAGRNLSRCRPEARWRDLERSLELPGRSRTKQTTWIGDADHVPLSSTNELPSDLRKPLS